MKAVSLLYHDAIEGGNSEESGFLGPGATEYKLEVTDLGKHFEALANIDEDRLLTVHEFLRPNNIQSVPLFITFDDGGKSAFTYILELLEKYNLIGHFFITASLTNTPAFVSDQEIRELKEKGNIIGSHSWSHPDRMASCSWEKLMEEWKKSIGILSDIIGETVDVASVPGGYFSRMVAETASACGIRALFTSEPIKKCYYVGNCLVIGRYTLMRGMMPVRAVGLSKKNLTRQQINQYLYWNIRKVAKVLGGRYYLTGRKILLEYFR